MRPFMRNLFLATAALLATPVQAQTATPPKLVVAISVDQFSADLFQAYRPLFTGGLGRLAREGTVFANGFQSHAATETCPGHSTLLTGRHPAGTGIIANNWIDQRAARGDKTIYCAEDETAAGTTSSNYRVSPTHLKATTLGDRLKAVSPASRNIAIAGKDRAAVMMGGRAVDQRWYWDGKGWATDLAGTTTPKTIAALNQAFAAAIASPREPLLLPPQCQNRDKSYAVAPNVTVGSGRLDRAAGDARAARAHPEFDGAVLAGAFGLIQEMQLGRGAATDVLSVGLSATDYVGHSYGWGGAEMCLQMLSLDRSLGDFLARMDQTGIPYAVVLSADHGGMDIPERLRDKGISQAVRADPALAASELGKLLAPQFGRMKSVLEGEGIGGDIWLDRGVPQKDRPRVLRAAVERYRSHPQVYAVFTADELSRVPVPKGQPDKWTVIQRVRASFDPARSGDFIVVLKPYVSPIAKPSKGYVATHGSPWDYDRRVPILFWRKGMAGADRAEAVETVDILPTLGAMIGLAVPANSVDGRCLDGAAGTVC